MTALAARELHGIGQRVRTSSYGVMVWMQSWEINHSSISGTLLERAGAHHPNVPGIVGIYATSDGGAFCVGITSNEAWQDFCQFGGIPEIGADPRWDRFEKRSPMKDFEWVERSRELRTHFARAMRTRSTDEWEQFFDQRREDVMYQRIFNYEDVMTTHRRSKMATSSRKTSPASAPPRWSASPSSSAKHPPQPSPGSHSSASTPPKS